LVLVFFEDFILTLYCDAYKVERLIKFIQFTENYKTGLFRLSNSILFSGILITMKKFFKNEFINKNSLNFIYFLRKSRFLLNKKSPLNETQFIFLE
jgi:hypothetical protein